MDLVQLEELGTMKKINDVLRPTVSRPVLLSVEALVGPITRF
jgi:hypothetical protein